jgi:hypothetical protein
MLPLKPACDRACSKHFHGDQSGLPQEMVKKERI